MTTDLALDTLEARGLIRLAAAQPELEYLFRHALLQDTAYESLLKQERRTLHQVVGMALEELYPERVGEMAAVLARHFEQAGDTDKAIDYLQQAAKFAIDRNAITEAYELYGRASALLPEYDPGAPAALRRLRIEIELGRAQAGFTFLNDDQQHDILQPLIAQSAQLGDLRLEADVHLAVALQRQLHGGRPVDDPELAASLDRVNEIGRELNDPLIAALATSIVGLYEIFSGRMLAGVARLEAVQPLLEQKRDFVGSAFALVALAMGYARLGEFEKSEVAVAKSKALAEQGDVVVRVDALIGESTLHSLRGDLESAVPLATQCTQLAEAAGASACVVASNFVLGDAYMRQGQFAAAKIAFDRSDEIAQVTDQQVFKPSIAAYLRSLGASMGDFDAHGHTFDKSIAEARDIGDLFGEANIVWRRAETEAKKPAAERNVAQMLADYATAVASFTDMGARPFVARSMRDWGHALLALGRTDDGRARLTEARDQMAQMGIKREADELTAELATAEPSA
jgi:tetratricopeptide (TPR) repeat protein